jgi:hypothetical protein
MSRRPKRHKGKHQQGPHSNGQGSNQNPSQASTSLDVSGSSQHESQTSGEGRIHQVPKPDQQRGMVKVPSIVKPRSQIARKQLHPKNPKSPTKKYSIVFFDTLMSAKSDLAKLEEMSKNCDQLNVVIRSEANMDDEDLNKFSKVFAGAAWALIHERRVQDGWYEQPQE